MPEPLVPNPDQLDQATQVTTLLAAVAAVLAAIYATVRWPVRSLATATHRFFGEIAFKEELARNRETYDTMQRVEPRLDVMDTRLAYIEQSQRLLLRHLLPGVQAPDHPLPPFPPSSPRTPEVR